MNTVKLNWLELTNFKGIKSFRLETIGDITNVFGKNEAGKSTLSDAWHWLLTGKDQFNRADFNIKNTVDTSLNRSEHVVSAGITVNGQPVTLKRVLLENWRKPKGQLHPVYSGNDTTYFYNDVPLLAGEYQKKIAEFLPDLVLKMITNPFYFNSQPWKAQREVLFNMAGNISDAEIAATKPEFAALLAKVTGKTLEEYKKQIANDKKRVKEQLDKKPIEIGEANRHLPELEDYAAIQQQIDDKLSTIADIDTLITDENARVNKLNEARSAKQQEIYKAKSDLAAIENDLRVKLQREANDAVNNRNMAENKIQAIEANIKSKKRLLTSTKARIETLNSELEELRLKFAAENERALIYDTDKFECPTCKRGLEPGDIEAAKAKMQENFIEAKTKTLNGYNAEGIAKNASIADAETLVKQLTDQISGLEVELTTAQAEKTALGEPGATVDINGTIAANAKVIEAKNNIATLEAELAEPVAAGDISNENAQKAAINAEITPLREKLAGKAQREKIAARIVELKNEESKLAQELADLEGIEFTLDDFTRARIEETERRINGLFDATVSFNLYDFTIEGNAVEVCQAQLKGVPYADVNTAGKVQLGLHIINALSAFYQVQAPIFIDCRESVSEIPATQSQIINLIVSENDAKLRVE